MRKFLPISFAAIIGALSAGATPVTPNDALAIAKNFSTQASIRNIHAKAPDNIKMELAHTQKSTTCNQALYYVFNYDQNLGYVIVSGDDRMPPIIGYSPNGNFSLLNLPDNMQGMIHSWNAQAEWLIEHPDCPMAQVVKPEKAVAPLLGEIKWDQGDPYNRSCPNVTQYNSQGDKLSSKAPAATGCVATALGQIMYYNQWPEIGTGSIRYTSSGEDDKINISVNFEGHQYNWDNMLPTLTSSSPAEAISEVSTFLFHVGASFQSIYGASTGATDVSVAPALKKYFGYDKGIRYVIRDYYTEQAWNDMLYNELKEGRPVAYGGLTRRWEGHFFVLDGVNEEGYYHINWGWGGQSDGYFLLSLLSPNSQGIGGASSNDAFQYGQNMIIGIQKPGDTPATEQQCFTAEILNNFNETISRQGTALLRATGVWNNSATACTANLGFVLIDSEGNTVYRQMVHNGKNYDVAYGEETLECAFAIPVDIPEGRYTIRPAYQVNSDDYSTDHFIMLPVGRADRWSVNVTDRNIEFTTTGKFAISILGAYDENGNTVTAESKKIIVKVNNAGTEFNGRAQVRCYINGKQNTVGRTQLNGTNDSYIFMSIPAGESELVYNNTFNLPGHENYVFEIRGCEGHPTVDQSHQSLAILAKKSGIAVEGPEMPPFLEVEDNMVVSSMVAGEVPVNDVRVKVLLHNDGGQWTGQLRMKVYESGTWNGNMGYITFDDITVDRESEQWVILDGGEFPEGCKVGSRYDLMLIDPIRNETMYPSDYASLDELMVGEAVEKKPELSIDDLTISPEIPVAGETARFSFEVFNKGYLYNDNLTFAILLDDKECFRSQNVMSKIKRSTMENVVFEETMPQSLISSDKYTVRLLAADNSVIGEETEISIKGMNGGVHISTDDSSINVSSERVTVRGASHIRVYTFDGRLVAYASGDQLAISHLPHGIYILKTEIAGETHALKFFINNK